jgi:intracellular sulfur oxidation DsrE/DsrF family protein
MSNRAVGVPEGEACAVLVLRHDSIGMAMPDAMWAKYGFGEMFKVEDGATKSPAVRNPFYNPKPGEMPLPDMSLDMLLKSNILVGVCDMALTVYSGMAAKKMSMEADAIKKEWLASIFPGIQVVPSGVLAVNRAQERGCSYCYAG